jgi:glycosyltransferase involved in cell wall biosynthesis
MISNRARVAVFSNANVDRREINLSEIFNLRVAIVHDWLPLYGGAERVLEQIIRVFPAADLFSVVDFIPEGQRDFLFGKPVQTSFVQKLPFVKSQYRNYLPLMPLAIEQFDLSGYDLVISSSYAVAKGVITGPDQLHICYCHSPMRYAWDMQNQYVQGRGILGTLRAWLQRALLHYIRLWDVRTAHGVNEFIANSTFIARRIQKVYRRDSTVINPPVDIGAFKVNEGEREDYYVTASRLVPYKKIDLIVKAFSLMPDRRLVVIGDGPEFQKIKALAGDNVTLLGHQTFEMLQKHLRNARAFIFAAEEDFGIAPVEAQACGTPVIAFGKGGVRETVVAGTTGLFFNEQTPESLIMAVNEFETVCGAFKPAEIRKHSEQFSNVAFRSMFAAFVECAWKQFQAETYETMPAENLGGKQLDFPLVAGV